MHLAPICIHTYINDTYLIHAADVRYLITYAVSMVPRLQYLTFAPGIYLRDARTWMDMISSRLDALIWHQTRLVNEYNRTQRH